MRATDRWMVDASAVCVGGKKLWLLGLRLRGRVQLDSGAVAQSDAASHGVKLAVGVFAVVFFLLRRCYQLGMV